MSDQIKNGAATVNFGKYCIKSFSSVVRKSSHLATVSAEYLRSKIAECVTLVGLSKVWPSV